jgi:hypothetical protein
MAARKAKGSCSLLVVRVGSTACDPEGAGIRGVRFEKPEV